MATQMTLNFDPMMKSLKYADPTTPAKKFCPVCGEPMNDDTSDADASPMMPMRHDLCDTCATADWFWTYHVWCD